MRDLDCRTDIQALLLAWAFWRSHGHGLRLSYPHCSAYFRGKVRSGPEISDDLAQIVDLHVSRLGQKCVKGDLRYEAIVSSYLGNMPDNRIARMVKRDRRTVRKARIAGENWIENELLLDPMYTACDP